MVRTAFEHAPSHLLLLDRDLVVRYLNYATVGLTAEEVVGTTLLDHVTKADGQRILEARDRVEATGAPTRYEVSYRRSNGELALFEARLGPVLEDGRITGYVLLTHDVTERRQAEESLRSSEERYRSLIEDQEEFVVRWLPDGTRTFVNHAYCRYFGGERSEHLGTSFLPMIVPEHREQVAARLARLTPEHPVSSGEHRVTRADGSVGWTEWVDRAFFDGRGRMVEIQSVGRDVSVRKRAEEALRVSEERYRTLFEEAKDAVFETTPEGRLVDINDAGVELFGYGSKEAMLAIPDIGEALYARPQDRQQVKRRLEAHGYLKNEEVTLRRHDGTPITALESAAVIRDDSGEIVAYRGMLHDISERLRLERRLAQAERLESVGKLAGGVAHDFNNLLTVILGNAELLLEELSAEDSRRAPLEEISGAAGRANTLTHRLLAFGRRQVLQPEVMNLNEIVEETEAMLGRVIGEDVELTTDLAPRLGCVRADPGQIQQALLNLAFNARDAMPRGGTLSIRTRDVDWAPAFGPEGPARQEGEWVQLSVGDTGAGIDPAIQERIFEPFFTTKEPDRGTGLGLASVYGVVKQSGGYITLESELGSGSRFDIFLPRVDATPRPRTRRSALARLKAPNRGRVLLVEDEAGVRELVRRVFEHAGYDVIVAADGREALEAASACDGEIDLLVTDVVMPRLSGFELAERLVGERPRLRVLFLTGHSDEAVERLEAPSGRHHILIKPFSPRDLLESVRIAMRET